MAEFVEHNAAGKVSNLAGLGVIETVESYWSLFTTRWLFSVFIVVICSICLLELYIHLFMCTAICLFAVVRFLFVSRLQTVMAEIAVIFIVILQKCSQFKVFTIFGTY